MSLINVVWCDDNIDGLNSDANRELFNSHKCRIYKTAKTAKQLVEILKDKNFIDAVIVDFNMSDEDLIPSNTTASGFRWVHEHLSDYSPTPFYLYSGRDKEFIEDKYRAFEFSKENDYFFTPNSHIKSGRNRYYQNGELEALLTDIEEEVTALNTPEFKVRKEFSKAFTTLESFNLDTDVFIQILLSDENADRYELRDKVNPLRKVLEKMVSKFMSDGIIPDGYAFNKIPDLFHGKDKANRKYSESDYMHESLFEAFNFIVAYIQDGSHNTDNLSLKLHDYLRSSGDSYILKAIAIIELDVVKWMGAFYDKYIPLKPFKFEPFEAVVREITTENNQEGAIVYDANNKKYFVRQPNDPADKYSEGSRIKISQRRPTTRNFGDYYVWRAQKIE